ncbi:DUF3034 family protein [Alteromonas sp. ZYF713]|nr:DUF3034 family protein [Alteromonas sp. ZYF713]
MRTIFLSIFVHGISLSTFAGDGKLIGNAGLQQIEGAGGGGIVPWAILAGYDTDTDILALSPLGLHNRHTLTGLPLDRPGDIFINL